MRSYIILLFSFVLTLSFYSCQKEVDGAIDPSGSSTPSTGTANLKAKINGAQWTANRLAGASQLAGMINLTGFSSDKKIVTITLTDSGVHKYTLSDVTMNAAAFIDSSEANTTAYTTNQGVYPAESGGEVNITSIDTAKKTMSGTFSFKLFREMDRAKKTVTEGSFTNISYSTSMPPAAATDSFRVKINGSAWTPNSISAFTASGQMIINATNSAASKTVGLVFPSNIKPGTYNLDFWGQTYVGQYNPDLDPLHAKASISGTLNILEHNLTTRRIRGTFAFRGEEMQNAANYAELTDGYFSVKY